MQYSNFLTDFLLTPKGLLGVFHKCLFDANSPLLSNESWHFLFLFSPQTTTHGTAKKWLLTSSSSRPTFFFVLLSRKSFEGQKQSKLNSNARCNITRILAKSPEEKETTLSCPDQPLLCFVERSLNRLCGQDGSHITNQGESKTHPLERSVGWYFSINR